MKTLRIDERLIHGQVIIGWIENLSINNLYLLHDGLNEFILDNYSSMLSNINFSAINLSVIKSFKIENNSLLVIGNLTLLNKYIDIIDLIKPDLINLGGIRHSDADYKPFDFIQLTKEEINIINEIDKKYQIKINAQELPYSKEFNIIEIIKKYQSD